MKMSRFSSGVSALSQTHDTTTFMSLGRVSSLRLSGSKLLFIDLIQEGHRLQGLCNLARLSNAGISASQFTDFAHSIRRGDIYGEPYNVTLST